MSTPNQEDLADLVSSFLENEGGKFYMQQLGLQYNGLHQQAESEGDPAKQARLINQATGLKYAINWLEERKKLKDSGYFKRDKLVM